MRGGEGSGSEELCHNDGPILRRWLWSSCPKPQLPLAVGILERTEMCLGESLALITNKVAGGGGWVSVSSGDLVQCTDLRRSMHPKATAPSSLVPGTYRSECMPEGSVGMLGICSVCT